MGFFGKLWARLRGMFIGAGDDLVSSSPEAIRATYAAAIDDAKRRYKEMEQAVALLAREHEQNGNDSQRSGTGGSGTAAKTGRGFGLG